MNIYKLSYLNRKLNKLVELSRKSVRDSLRLNEYINDLIDSGYSVRIDKINKLYIIERGVDDD